jgi:hypothetical protein
MEVKIFHNTVPVLCLINVRLMYRRTPIRQLVHPVQHVQYTVDCMSIFEECSEILPKVKVYSLCYICIRFIYIHSARSSWRKYKDLTVRDGAEFKNNSWKPWFIFNLQRNKQSGLRTNCRF